MDMWQIILYLSTLLILVVPLGTYMARVYQGQSCGLSRFLRPLENGIYRLCGTHPEQEMGWKSYLTAMIFFNFVGLLFIYLIQRLQFFLPLNPQHFTGVAPDLAFNTAASFITNTGWQAYGGEATLSYFTQMVGLTVPSFLSAATGMALLVALIRGLVRHESTVLGNFWVDAVRSVLYILLPLSFIFALALVSQGVIQNFKPYQKINLIQSLTYQDAVLDAKNNSHFETKKMFEQVIPMGPVASQVAIKQLATSGGGFFNVNSAHPFENPTPLSNFLEMLAILLIPAALCYTFGIMVKDRRQGWTIMVAMLLLLIPMMLFTTLIEQHGNPIFTQLGIDQVAQHGFVGGNMEGKETRLGIVNSALWATVTTATSNGSVNAMHGSFMPLSSLIMLWMMHLGEVVFGGVGSGLYGMLMLIIIIVFIAGLMVGRTPEYLGKKIEPHEMKMASLSMLVMPVLVLVCTALAVMIRKSGDVSTAHRFTEILYAFTSMANNNGSAFGGLAVNTVFFNTVGGIAMLIVRYWVAIPALAIAGSLARKKQVPSGIGTLSTCTPFFAIFLAFFILIFGTLTFLPALALGPIAEHLMQWGQYGH